MPVTFLLALLAAIALGATSATTTADAPKPAGNVTGQLVPVPGAFVVRLDDGPTLYAGVAVELGQTGHPRATIAMAVTTLYVDGIRTTITRVLGRQRSTSFETTARRARVEGAIRRSLQRQFDVPVRDVLLTDAAVR